MKARLAAAVLTAAAGLTACSSHSSGGGPAAGSSGAVTSGTQVAVTEKEFSLALSQTTLTAGSYTFVAHNDGSVTHALDIDGPGVEDASTGAISPGSSKSVTVTLEPGTYDVYCPVGNHKSMGMDATLTVT